VSAARVDRLNRCRAVAANPNAASGGCVKGSRHRLSEIEHHMYMYMHMHMYGCGVWKGVVRKGKHLWAYGCNS